MGEGDNSSDNWTCHAVTRMSLHDLPVVNYEIAPASYFSSRGDVISWRLDRDRDHRATRCARLCSFCGEITSSSRGKENSALKIRADFSVGEELKKNLQIGRVNEIINTTSFIIFNWKSTVCSHFLRRIIETSFTTSRS